MNNDQHQSLIAANRDRLFNLVAQWAARNNWYWRVNENHQEKCLEIRPVMGQRMILGANKRQEHVSFWAIADLDYDANQFQDSFALFVLHWCSEMPGISDAYIDYKLKIYFKELYIPLSNIDAIDSHCIREMELAHWHVAKLASYLTEVIASEKFNKPDCRKLRRRFHAEIGALDEYVALASVANSAHQ